MNGLGAGTLAIWKPRERVGGSTARQIERLKRNVMPPTTKLTRMRLLASGEIPISNGSTESPSRSVTQCSRRRLESVLSALQSRQVRAACSWTIAIKRARSEGYSAIGAIRVLRCWVMMLAGCSERLCTWRSFSSGGAA